MLKYADVLRNNWEKVTSETYASRHHFSCILNMQKAATARLHHRHEMCAPITLVVSCMCLLAIRELKKASHLLSKEIISFVLPIKALAALHTKKKKINFLRESKLHLGSQAGQGGDLWINCGHSSLPT